MNKILAKTQGFIMAKQSSMVSSTLVLSSMIILARLFGFVRYFILTNFFTVDQLDVYFAAFKIPDLIFEVLISGALTTTLIPFFIKYQKDRTVLSRNISLIVNFISICLFALILILLVFMPYIMVFITPGFSKEKTDAVIYLSRILLIGQLPFLVIGNFLTGISQARKRFLIPALAPTVYNIAIILVTILFSTNFHLQAPIIGVITGAFLFFIVQLPVIFYADFDYRPILFKSKVLWDFFRIAVPRIFTVMVGQIEATIDLSLATLTGSGSYALYYLAQHLQLLPVSVIGIAFGQASLPYLSELYENNNIEEFKKIIISSILNLFFFLIPISLFLIFARTPIVRIFFGGDKFSLNNTNLTALILSYFALSIPFHSIYYFLTRCFYAMFDSRTPFYISVFSIILNAVLSLFFVLVLKLPVWSLALSFSLAMDVSVILLLIMLNKKLGDMDFGSLIVESIKMAFASSVAAIIAYGVYKLFDQLIFDTTRTLNVLLLVGTITIVHFVLYLFLSWALNISEFMIIIKLLMKAKEYRRKIFEVYKGIE